jgi:hypothetical protein
VVAHASVPSAVPCCGSNGIGDHTQCGTAGRPPLTRITHTALAGKRFFDELDQDGDGRINVNDLKRAMKSRNLPEDYAFSFMDRAKRNPFARSIGYPSASRHQPTFCWRWCWCWC